MAHIRTVSVSSKGQIVIPEEIRKDLKIKEGSKLVLVETGNKIVLEKESDFLAAARTLSEAEKERLGWMILAEQSLAKVWDNPKDEAVWKKYL